MKISIEVKSKEEAKALQAGLANPDVHAFVVMCGVLDVLPHDRARQRVLGWMNDLIHDPDFHPKATAPTTNGEQHNGTVPNQSE